MAHRILVADDDPHIRDVICFALEKAGMVALPARDGTEALALTKRESPDLAILDIGMPEADGLEVCRQIRKTSDMPILFLSSRDEEIDRVLGLEIGGDDYVTKPFSPRELVARVGAIVRRTGARTRPRDEPTLSLGSLSIDPLRRTVDFGGASVELTAIEFDILRALLARPGIVMTREQIMRAAYPAQIHVSDRTIDSHIRNVRAKLAAAGATSSIETVHGVGFRMAAPAV